MTSLVSAGPRPQWVTALLTGGVIAVLFVVVTFIGRDLAVLFHIAIVIAIYFAPAIVAWRRRHHNTLAIFVTNLVFGWTVVGWLAALVWACTRVQR